MRNKCSIKNLLALSFLLSLCATAFAGDSLRGRVTEVRSGNVVVLDYGKGSYVVHLVGVEITADTALANQAKQLLSDLVLGKNARMRLASRLPNGEMSGRLLGDDPQTGVRDLGIEVVRSGLARRSTGEDYQFEYKYNELSTAEREARAAQRGLWRTNQPPR